VARFIVQPPTVLGDHSGGVSIHCAVECGGEIYLRTSREDFAFSYLHMEVLVTDLTRRIVEVGHGLPERLAASNVIRHFCKRPAAKDRGHMVKDSADESGGCEIAAILMADIDLTQKF